MKMLTVLALAGFAATAFAQQGSGVTPVTATIVTTTLIIRPDGVSQSATSTSLFYRDGSSRTRIEEGQHVTINDPVSRTIIDLDLAKGLAVVTSLGGSSAEVIAAAGGTTTLGKVPTGTGTTPETATTRTATAPGLASATGGHGRGATRLPVVSLGQGVVSGVPAVGYRSELILVPGAMGNIQPMRRISEMWRSTELGLQLKTSRTDNEILLTGERRAKQVVEVYQNIVPQATVNPSLFTIPAGFAVTQSTPNR